MHPTLKFWANLSIRLVVRAPDWFPAGREFVLRESQCTGWYIYPGICCWASLSLLALLLLMGI